MLGVELNLNWTYLLLPHAGFSCARLSVLTGPWFHKCVLLLFPNLLPGAGTDHQQRSHTTGQLPGCEWPTGEKGYGCGDKGGDPGTTLTHLLLDPGRRSSLSRQTSPLKCANLSSASLRRLGTGHCRVPVGPPLLESASRAPGLALPWESCPLLPTPILPSWFPSKYLIRSKSWIVHYSSASSTLHIYIISKDCRLCLQAVNNIWPFFNHFPCCTKYFFIRSSYMGLFVWPI